MQSDHGEPAGEVHHEHTIPIIVAGEQHVWHHQAITYEELVSILFPGGLAADAYPHSISYTTPDGKDGALHRDESVKIGPEMKFYVRSTHKS